MKTRTKLVLVCAFLVLLTSAGTAFAGVDVIVDGDGFVQNEISLTSIPGQPNDLIMAYNDNPYSGAPSGLGSAYSQDRGASWNTTQLPFPSSPGPVPPPSPMTREFDPTITADANGNVFAGFIADGANWQYGLSDSGLYVCKTTDGGKNWGTPVQVSYDAPPTKSSPDPNYRFNDRCQITADTVSNDSNLGNIYIAWIKDRGSGATLPSSDIYFSRSTDVGQTFSTPIMINDPNNHMGNMPVPAVASDGTVYVSWLDYNCLVGGLGTIYIRKSTDNGQTFPDWDVVSPDHFVATINLPPLVVSRSDGTLDTVAKGAPVLATSPNDANNLYIVYAADPDGPFLSDEASIFLIKSTDKGQNWSSPLQVNDDQTKTDQILPWIDVKPDGTIDVAWYDRRNDPLDIRWDVYVAKSIDRGVSFPANVCLTDQSFATPTNNWIGEYLGLAVDANDAYVAFTSSITDAVNGDIYFDRIRNLEITVPGDFEPDGDVDSYDFAVLAAAWRSTSGSGNWNLACDISDPNDNVIDNNDLDVFVGDWLYGR